MRPMVWSTSLHKHPDYDAEEAADLRQRAYSSSHETLLCSGQLLSEREVPRVSKEGQRLYIYI
jgi:hypothetical protein